MVVIVSGLPGAGKSTISKHLAMSYGGRAISTIVNHLTVELYDPEDPVYFFVNDELKYRMAFKPHPGLFILERGVESTYGYVRAHDRLFATARQALFDHWYKNVGLNLPHPHVHIHLTIDVGLSISRRYPEGIPSNEGVWTNAEFLEIMEQECLQFLHSHYQSLQPVLVDATRPLFVVLRDIEQLIIQK